MFGTKVEITLSKGEPGSWMKFEFPRQQESKLESRKDVNDKLTDMKIDAMSNSNDDDELNDSDGLDDLDDIEPVYGARITEFEEELVPE